MIPAEPHPRRLAALAAVALCILHAWLAFSAGGRNGPTYDELIHVTSGRAYWATGDYRFQPENGMLPQRLLALPLLRRDMELRADDRRATVAWAYADPWTLSRLWFFESGEDPAALLARARLMNAALGACLCWVVFAWSRSLFGDGGGLFSLTLAAFCPNLLANAGLATSDTSAALGFAISLLAWWRLLHRVSPGRIAAAGAATAFIALSKYSALLLAPMVLALVLCRLARPSLLPIRFMGLGGSMSGLRRKAPVLCVSALGAGLLAGALIWGAYGFRYRIAPNAEQSPSEWATVLIETPDKVGVAMAGAPDPADFTPVSAGGLQDVIRWSRDRRILPEGWLYGLAYVARNAKARLSYFNGEYSLTGWPAFFPVVFLAKTPPAGLAALAVSLAVIARRAGRGRRLYRCAPLLVGITVYFGAALSSRLNIGYRHLLPLLPLVWILAGALVAPFAGRGRAGRVAIGLLVGGQALSALGTAPFYLTYFNGPSGGSGRGDRLFVDSSLDWGQGMPELDRWLSENHRGEVLHLSYFGSDDTRRFRWNFVRIADELFDHGNRPLPAPMRGGLYCLGATQFRRVYTKVRGGWSARYESAYQELNAWFAQEDLSRDPLGGPPLSAEMVSKRLRDLEHLRFGRLCEFLADRAPDARPGNSILVFRLSDEEVWRALAPSRRPTTDSH